MIYESYDSNSDHSVLATDALSSRRLVDGHVITAPTSVTQQQPSCRVRSNHPVNELLSQG